MMTFIRKNLSPVYVSVGWSILILILLCLPGSILPDERKFRIPQFDKLVHIGLFGLFVYFWCLHLSTRNKVITRRLRLFFRVFVIAGLFGITMEFVQKYFIPNRDFDEADIIADLIGAGLAYGISNITLLLSNE